MVVRKSQLFDPLGKHNYNKEIIPEPILTKNNCGQQKPKFKRGKAWIENELEDIEKKPNKAPLYMFD